MTRATVDMGRPVLDPAQVPVSAEPDATAPFGDPYAGALELDSPWGAFAFCCVSMGNPHAVCFLDGTGLDEFDVDAVGAFFESHPAFPEKTNVEFAVVGPHGIAMRVFERGCGETLARDGRVRDGRGRLPHRPRGPRDRRAAARRDAARCLGRRRPCDDDGARRRKLRGTVNV